MEMTPHAILRFAGEHNRRLPGLDTHAAPRVQAIQSEPAGDAQERARVVLDSIAEAVLVVDAAGRVDYLNPVAELLTGWPTEAAIHLPFERVCRLIDEKTRQAVKLGTCRRGKRTPRDRDGPHVLLLTGDGRELAVHESVSPLRDGSRGAVIVLHDVSREREAALQLSYRATHDALTGLVNRYEAEQRIARVIARARADGSRHALAYIDLDQFKTVNDNSGHAAGDELLCRFSELLKERVRARDTVARLGGDEFVILLENCSLVRAQAIIEDLMQALDKFRFHWADRSFRIGASIGLTAIRRDSEDMATVFAAADAACYVAKNSGRNRLVIHGLSGAMAKACA